METRVSMVVPTAHARHGMHPQDDSTNGTVQHNYGSVCRYVALVLYAYKKLVEFSFIISERSRRKSTWLVSRAVYHML